MIVTVTKEFTLHADDVKAVMAKHLGVKPRCILSIEARVKHEGDQRDPTIVFCGLTVVVRGKP